MIKIDKGGIHMGPARSGSNILLLLIIFAAGGILGNIIGDIFGTYFPILEGSRSVGFTSPIELDLNFIYLQFALMVRLNLAGIIGLIAAAWLFRKL